jgi:hypothetical protein
LPSGQRQSGRGEGRGNEETEWEEKDGHRVLRLPELDYVNVLC